MAALSVQSSSGARAASGSAARSSEFAATPPTTAICSAPVCSAAASVRSTRAADDRPLVRGGEVGAPPLELLVAEVANLVQQRRLEAREREVEARHARDREVERLGVALLREAVDRGAARVAEPEQPRALVERLAGRVVERRAEDVEARRGPARRAGACGRRSRAGRGTAARPGRAPGRAMRRGRAGGRPAPAEAAAPRRAPSPPRARRAARRSAPGPRVTATRSTSVELGSGLAERLADHGRHELEVPPRRDLRHDAAVARVEVGLGGDDVRRGSRRRR